MTHLCTLCGERLAGAAMFCARCGICVTHPQEEPHHEPLAEKVPTNGAFSGRYRSGLSSAELDRKT